MPEVIRYGPFDSKKQASANARKLRGEGYKTVKVVHNSEGWFVLRKGKSESNPSSVLRKLRKGIRRHIKLSRGRLIIKT